MDKKLLTAQLGNATDLQSLVSIIIGMIRGYIVPLIMALALLVFLWGVFKTMTAEGDSKKRQEGIAYITYGIIGLAVMVSVWSLVYLLTSTFFTSPLSVPQIN